MSSVYCLWIFFFFNDSHSGWCEVISHYSFDFCFTNILIKNPLFWGLLTDLTEVGASQGKKEHVGAAGRRDFLRNLYNEIEAFRHLPGLRDCSRHCGYSSEENRLPS